PGSNGYSVAQETTQNDAFLDSWAGTNPTKHGVIFNEAANGSGPYDCSRCHADNNALLLGLPEFRVAWIGTDLSDDHPVGVQLPDTAVYDFNPTSGIDGSLKFYDTNSNGRADTNEVRFYDTGGGYEVECASCHDPHGVPSAGAGTKLIPSFLRIDNNSSTLCLTCHTK
ncbi:Cytochrome c family protein, partial [hydrothermal vent metagenome]